MVLAIAATHCRARALSQWKFLRGESPGYNSTGAVCPVSDFPINMTGLRCNGASLSVSLSLSLSLCASLSLSLSLSPDQHDGAALQRCSHFPGPLLSLIFLIPKLRRGWGRTAPRQQWRRQRGFVQRRLLLRWRGL